MIIFYEPHSDEIIDDEFIEDASSVIAAIIEAETVINDGIPCSDKALNILSRQIERKQTKIKKIEAIVEKTETLNNLNRNTLASLEEMQSKIKRRFDEAEDIITCLDRLFAVKGNSSVKK